MEEGKEFEYYLNNINIQDVLQHAGLSFVPRDGKLYPCYVQTDDSGNKISNSKVVVYPRHNTCFMPPAQKSYNVISLITKNPDMFNEYKPGMSEYRLVHLVCRNILNIPEEKRISSTVNFTQRKCEFDGLQYSTLCMKGGKFESAKPFYPFFVSRGIDYYTQLAFRHDFCIASKHVNGGVFRNLSFPLTIPETGKMVGYEQRGLPQKNGKSGYKGVALGSDCANAVWMSNLSKKPLDEVGHVYWFESAYDAMAFYQLHRNKKEYRDAVYVSTTGTLCKNQITGMVSVTPNAVHHLCFDNDAAGQSFADTFRHEVTKQFNLDKNTTSQSLKQWLLDKGHEVDPEMKAFVDGYKGSVFDLFSILHFDKETELTLPKELQQLHKDYVAASDKIYGQETSSMSQEEREKAHLEMSESYNSLKESLLKSLHLSDMENQSSVKVVRELPKEGFKDWNEELLGYDKEEGFAISARVDSGVDIDGDGINEEEVELVEEREKKHYTR